MDKYIDVSMLSMDQLQQLLGINDNHLKLLEATFHVTITYHQGQIHLVSENKDALNAATMAMQRMVNDILANVELTMDVARYEVNHDDTALAVAKLNEINIGRTISGKLIHPKTQGQYQFNIMMDEKPITFALGPAGTGKTYLAVVKAVTALKHKDVERIVLTRPAVEAGENLGFLPGDLKEKVDPYLTPLYDCLNEMLGFEAVENYIEKNIIEIAPLAYMRGRTLNKAFVILDEAQNTTIHQMKMFLTRLGFGSRMVITGDPSQIDLDYKVTSGLIDAVAVCRNIDEIGIIELTSDDVVRNPIVAKIIDAYARHERKKQHANHR